MAYKYDPRARDANILQWEQEINERTLQLVNYFAMDTVEAIIRHIDRLHIKNTGELRSSIKAITRTNAGGNDFLVTFFALYYADAVEQAVGRYWGVDADLKKGRGLDHLDISSPPIEQVNYGPMPGIFHQDKIDPKKDPKKKVGADHDALRARTHHPRPFFRSEIRRQIERISFRMMREAGRNMEIHVLNNVSQTTLNMIESSLRQELEAALLSPYSGQKNGGIVKTYVPRGPELSYEDL